MHRTPSQTLLGTPYICHLKTASLTWCTRQACSNICETRLPLHKKYFVLQSQGVESSLVLRLCNRFTAKANISLIAHLGGSRSYSSNSRSRIFPGRGL